MGDLAPLCNFYAIYSTSASTQSPDHSYQPPPIKFNHMVQNPNYFLKYNCSAWKRTLQPTQCWSCYVGQCDPFRRNPTSACRPNVSTLRQSVKGPYKNSSLYQVKLNLADAGCFPQISEAVFTISRTRAPSSFGRV